MPWRPIRLLGAKTRFIPSGWVYWVLGAHLFHAHEDGTVTLRRYHAVSVGSRRGAHLMSRDSLAGRAAEAARERTHL